MSNRSSFCHGVVFFNLLKTHRTTILLLSTSMVLSFLVYFIWESQKMCSLKRVFGTYIKHACVVLIIDKTFCI